MSAVHLEPFAERHLPFVSELVDDPLVRRFTRVPDSPADDFARTWLERYEAGRVEGTREAFAIVDAEGTPLGLALAPHIDGDAATVELGYVVSRHARGRGVASAALAQLTAWALAEAGAERVELFISVDNDASQRVAERCGYRLEGVLRSAYIKPGVREDTQIWSRLSTDP